MAIIITAPQQLTQTIPTPYRSLFLAGGISNCPDWQSDLVQKITHFDNLVVFNPRRLHFDIENPDISSEQIAWEYQQLRMSDIIVFWFSEGSLNPITLYEYGYWGSNMHKTIICGVHPNYPRKFDVLYQTSLAFPNRPVHESFHDFTTHIVQILST